MVYDYYLKIIKTLIEARKFILIALLVELLSFIFGYTSKPHYIDTYDSMSDVVIYDWISVTEYTLAMAGYSLIPMVIWVLFGIVPLVLAIVFGYHLGVHIQILHVNQILSMTFLFFLVVHCITLTLICGIGLWRGQATAFPKKYDAKDRRSKALGVYFGFVLPLLIITSHFPFFR